MTGPATDLIADLELFMDTPEDAIVALRGARDEIDEEIGRLEKLVAERPAGESA